MVGRLQRFKGPFDFLDVAALALGNRPEARFLVIGPDSPIEPGLRTELQSAIDARGLGASVGLAGRLSGPDLAATVRAATLLVHPAHREPFGLAVVEALALATPVVAYATTGPSSILAEGGGALVPVGDTKALATVILGALDDAGTLAAWQAQAPVTASRFDLSAIIGRYLEVLQGAASARPGVATVGVVPPGSSGVRDHGRLLGEALRRRGHKVEEHWLENHGTSIAGSALMTGRLLRLALTMPSRERVLWHYCPVPYGWRGIPGPGVFLGLVLRARGCQVVSVLHELAYTYRPGLDPPRAKVKALAQRLALRVVMAGSSEVVVTTDARRAAAEKGRRSRRVHVVPVFPTVPVAGPVRSDDTRPLVIGVPGYAGDGVRPDVLVEALALLDPPNSVRTVLLGAPGPDSDDGRRWRRLAGEHRVDGLEFTGVVESSELSRHFAGCHVVVLVNEEGPSARKTTLATSLAHGVAVVSLDGYNRWEEVVAAGAVHVVPADPVALAAVLADLRDSPLKRSAMAARGLVFAAEHMNLEAAATTFATLLDGRSGT
jgi:glycosyltransferase involved in cell wall biosynthesis